MPGWTFAEFWEHAADSLPTAPFAVQGERVVTWGDADRRADAVAATLLDAGAVKQDKVAQYLYNCPEYLESQFACFKASLVPVNTNYRYTADELIYLWDNADAVAVVFHGTFADTIEDIRERLPKVRTWLWVDDGSGPCPVWAVPYEDAAARPTDGRVVPDHGRDGDDLNMLYTGGTTGMPKGVMWRQDDLVVTLSSALATPVPDEHDPAFVDTMHAQPGPVGLPACPLMHGTGGFTAFSTLTQGGCVALLPSRHFDPIVLLDTIETQRVNAMAIVGDAFAKPILAALDAEPGRWDLSSLVAIVSSGVMWSEETKLGLLGHHPNMILQDAFSSSEALGMGASISGGGAAAKTARFELSPNTIVIDDLGERITEPGVEGRLAVGGRQPLGYYKDEEKSARTFIMVDGKRYSCPGDYAVLDEDGKVSVLGRGSVCINSGGEKVFPEEVEEAIKTYEGVRDAVVVGVPHERFGEMVVAVVEPAGDTLAESELIEHVRGKIAAYKAPRRVIEVDGIGRAPNGKVDYKRLRALATDRV
jgi:acyl-CoA synthetase (AMP-forming)/AMP-acid ligase II